MKIGVIDNKGNLYGPINANVDEDLVASIKYWRQTPHDYEESRVVSKGIQTLFCGKCGQSKGWFIHNQNTEK